MATIVLSHTAPAPQDAGFETVVRAEGPRLFAVALAVLRDPGEAEDGLQEAMVLAWRSWGQLRDPLSRRAWLTRITVRQCIHRRRSFLGRRQRETAVTGAERAADFRASDGELDQAYRRLTPRQRAVVALHYHHGYTLDETARLIGCRPGTARSHLARALTTLRTELEHG